MEALTAAVVLAWLVLVVLAFAMAGLLRQLRDLQVALARSQQGGPTAGTPTREIPASVRPRAGAAYAVVLVVDNECALCAEIAPVFAGLAAENPTGLDLLVLGRTSGEKFERLEGNARFVVDAAAWHRLDPGWRPALVAVDAEGTVVAAEPAGSEDAVRAVVADLAKVAAAGAQGSASELSAT